MTEETVPAKLTPDRSHSGGTEVPPPGLERELSELRKEVLEARNLVIKSDNLLKNLHADFKQMGRKQSDFERRHLLSSATAMIIFAILCAAGAILVTRSQVEATKQELGSSEARAREMGQSLAALQKKAADQRAASEHALKLFEKLANEKEGPGLADAVSQAARLDKGQLTPLEGRAIEEKVASLTLQIASASFERGRQAFHRNDMRTAATELSRHLELLPNSSDAPLANFWLGTARYQLRDYQNATAPLETFIRMTPAAKNVDYASLLLGASYEETAQFGKASEVYQRATAQFPYSQFSTQMRNKLRRLPALQAAASAGAAQGQPQQAAAAAPPPRPAAPAPAVAAPAPAAPRAEVPAPAPAATGSPATAARP